MKFVLMSLLLAESSFAMDALMKKMVHQTNKHVLEAECWGENNKNKYDLAVGAAMEKCMQLAPAIDLVNVLSPNNRFSSLFPSINVKNPFKQFQQFQDIDQLVSLWRNKRSAESSTGILQPDEDDFMEFLDDVDDFKEGMATKLGNLTCVMTEMKMLTPELKVNIEEYTKDMEEEEEIDLNETPIVADPEWRKRLTTGYQDCYDIAESIPSQALSKSPLSRVFGRQMIFFKCAKKNEKLNCAMGQMKRLVEEWYGSGENITNTDYGLPEDEYEAAALSVMVLRNGASEEERFVGDFFWGGHM